MKQMPNVVLYPLEEGKNIAWAGYEIGMWFDQTYQQQELGNKLHCQATNKAGWSGRLDCCI